MSYLYHVAYMYVSLACGRSVSSSIGRHERKARRWRRRERKAREREKARARLVSQLARELDDKYGDASDGILRKVKREHDGWETGSTDAMPFMFIALAILVAFAALDEAMSWDGCAVLLQAVAVVLGAFVAWFLATAYRAFKADIIADALGEVMSMRAARRGGE